jgi:hypothetical protein
MVADLHKEQWRAANDSFTIYTRLFLHMKFAGKVLHPCYINPIGISWSAKGISLYLWLD